MNKILILDNRVERKKNHMSDAALKQLSECEEQGYVTFFTGEGLEKDLSFQYCEEYSLLATHKSWLDSNELTTDMVEYAKKEQKLLVIFSGGIGQTLLLDEFKRLSVNSADFYSEKLPSFIKRYAKGDVEQPLLELLYGEAWRIPIYMQYRDLVWKGVSEESDEYERFELNYDLYIKDFKQLSQAEKLNLLNRAINEEILKSKTL